MPIGAKPVRAAAQRGRGMEQRSQRMTDWLVVQHQVRPLRRGAAQIVLMPVEKVLAVPPDRPSRGQ